MRDDPFGNLPSDTEPNSHSFRDEQRGNRHSVRRSAREEGREAVEKAMAEAFATQAMAGPAPRFLRQDYEARSNPENPINYTSGETAYLRARRERMVRPSFLRRAWRKLTGRRHSSSTDLLLPPPRPEPISETDRVCHDIFTALEASRILAADRDSERVRLDDPDLPTTALVLTPQKETLPMADENPAGQLATTDNVASFRHAVNAAIEQWPTFVDAIMETSKDRERLLVVERELNGIIAQHEVTISDLRQRIHGLEIVNGQATTENANLRATIENSFEQFRIAAERVKVVMS